MRAHKPLYRTALLLLLAPIAARADSPAAEPSASPSEPARFGLSVQATLVPQTHPAFPAAYSGINSLLSTPEFAASFTTTLFLGARLWQGAAAYVDPELSAGTGLSSSHGVAGFPNGEIYRVDTPAPKPNLSRAYLQQTIALGQARERLEAAPHELGRDAAVERLTLVAGKFSLNDFFDANAYSHDPRTQFLNWALMDNGAWDYAADTRGYTFAFMAELNLARWAVRFATAMEPAQANQLTLDTDLAQAHGDNLEFEFRFSPNGHPGRLRALAYSNHAHMGDYAEALARSPSSPDITATRAYRVKYGFGLNAEQELRDDLGIFARLGWNDGATETWAFTEIDLTASVGASLSGALWRRPRDTVGLAFVVNGLSSTHEAYLDAGGSGFMLGDGALDYAPEIIGETYYSWRALKWLALSADFQLIADPGYNRSRGPVSAFAARAHLEL